MIDETVIATLKESLGDDGTVIQQLIDMYISDSPPLVADAVAALGRGDMATMARAAHSLKSTSASMGATAVSALARDLELHAKQNELAPSAAVLQRLQAELNDAIAAFAKLKF
jgi:HPt (histidine-containing phosphotransfer) domain-containing protein